MVQSAAQSGSGALLVIGEALIDEFPDGDRVAGGAPFNLARWLSAFGVPTTFVTRIGCMDQGARTVLASARRCGLSEAGIQRDAHWSTGRANVLPTPQGHRFHFEPESAWDHIDSRLAQEMVLRVQPSILAFGVLAQRHDESRAAIQHALSQSDGLKFLDVNLREVQGMRELAQVALSQADWVKVSEDELHQLLTWFDAPQPSGGRLQTGALQRLAEQFGIQRLIVTCGARGWYTVSAEGGQDGEGFTPSLPYVVDTVGAGDAFAAVLLAGSLRDWSLQRSLAAAARLGAAVCMQRGAIPEYVTFIDHWKEALGFGATARPMQD